MLLRPSLPQLRSPTLLALSAWLIASLSVWFILLVAIHLAKQATPDDEFIIQQTLAEQALQLFMFSCLLSAAALCTCWYAELERTKASRSMASVVCTLMKSSWLFQLWFIIPNFHSDESNWYCTAGAYFPVGASTSSPFCRLGRGVAAMSLCVGLGVFLLFMWTLLYRFQRKTPDVPIPASSHLLPAYNAYDSNAFNAAHNVDINWATVVAHPEDLEQASIASALPHLFSIRRRIINILARLGTVCVSIACFGVLLLTYPSIQFSDNTGLNAWNTNSDVVSINGDYSGWGDPIISGNWYVLLLTLTTSLGLSAYADARSNRSISVLAAMLVAISTSQFSSFFFYSVRRIHASAADLVSGSLVESSQAQYAEVSGAGLVLLYVFLLIGVLTLRYLIYLPITAQQHRAVHIDSHLDQSTDIPVVAERFATPSDGGLTVIHAPGPEHGRHGDIPSYNLRALTGVHPMLVALCSLSVLVQFSWWVVQTVSQWQNNVFTGVEPSMAYFYNERIYLMCSLVAGASLLPAVYAERHRSPAMTLTAFMTSSLMLATFILRVWPTAYQSLPPSGGLYENACGISWSWCQLTKASAGLAFAQGFLLFAAMVYTAVRLARAIRQLATEEKAQRGLRLSLPLLCLCLIHVTVWVWAFAVIAETDSSGTGFQEQSQTSPTASDIAQNDIGNGFTEGYWASQAFLLCVELTFVTWSVCYAAQMQYAWQSRGSRLFALASCVILATSLFPMLIFACRFAHLQLNGTEKTLVAVFIIMPLFSLALLAAVCRQVMEPFYHNAAAVTAPVTAGETANLVQAHHVVQVETITVKQHESVVSRCPLVKVPPLAAEGG